MGRVHAVTLVEFLEARIAEDEAMFTHADMHWPEIEGYLLVGFTEERALAECAAKRAIISQVSDVKWGSFAVRDFILEVLAVPYSSHPEFNPAWGTV